MTVSRIFVNVLVALIFTGIGLGNARAQASFPNCNTYSTDAQCADRASAVSAATAAAQYQVTRSGYSDWKVCPPEYLNDQGGTGGVISRVRVRYGGSCNESGYASRYWDPVAACAAAPALSNVSYSDTSSGGQVCKGGCAYTVDISAGTFRRVGTGASTRAFASSMKPSGGTCTASDTDLGAYDPTQSVCTAMAGQTDCVKPNGEHCVTGAAGSTLCWQPDLEGVRMTVDGTYAADREKAPKTPSAPTNQSDSTVINNSQTTINSTTYNTSTYSGTGNTGGQSTTGGGNDNGTGGTGSGNGDDGDGDDDGPGAPSGAVGTLYEDPNLTAAGIAAEYFGKVMDTPIAGEIRSFMTVPSGGGSCPTFQLPASTFWDAMTLDYHCDGAMLAALQAAGYLCLAMATYIAARIAFT